MREVAIKPSVVSPVKRKSLIGYIIEVVGKIVNKLERGWPLIQYSASLAHSLRNTAYLFFGDNEKPSTTQNFGSIIESEMKTLNRSKIHRTKYERVSSKLKKLSVIDFDV